MAPQAGPVPGRSGQSLALAQDRGHPGPRGFTFTSREEAPSQEAGRVPPGIGAVPAQEPGGATQGSAPACRMGTLPLPATAPREAASPEPRPHGPPLPQRPTAGRPFQPPVRHSPSPPCRPEATLDPPLPVLWLQLQGLGSRDAHIPQRPPQPRPPRWPSSLCSPTGGWGGDPSPMAPPDPPGPSRTRGGCRMTHV